MSVNTFLSPDSISFESKAPNRTLITLEPFERGFGHTLGNALRRILLSSLVGCAVVEAKIEGVLHEYAALEGVQEDMLDILLNLRGAAFIIHGNQDEVVLELKKHGIGPVCLDDIDLPPDVELVNPQYIIANLSKARDFNMILKVARGRGERVASVRSDDTQSIDVGSFHLDAVFNPVQRVSYTVEAKLGKLGKLDRLIIDLETNGTILPEVAIHQAAAILKEQLSVFLELKRPDNSLTTEQPAPIDPLYWNSIDTLLLSPRTRNCLEAEGIHFVGDLVIQTEEKLLHIPSLGKKSLGEIKKALGSHLLSLGTECAGWPPPDLVYPTVESMTESS